MSVRAISAGVVDPSPATAAFTVDRTAPEPELASPSPGAVVRPGEVWWEGTCGERPGDLSQVTIRIWQGAGASGTPQFSDTDPCDPYFGWYTQLTAGVYTIVVSQSDDVGNVGATAARQFTVQDAPVVHLDRPGDGEALNTRRPAFSGRAPGAGNASVTVHVRAAAAAAGDPDVQTLTAAVVDGRYSVSPLADLLEGAYRVRAERGGSGGPGSSGTSDFEVDVTAPAVAIASPADGTTSADESIAIAGSGESGGEIVVTAVGPDGTSRERTAVVTASAWSMSFAGLPGGDHVLTARQTDRAGNVGASSPRTLHIARPHRLRLPASASRRRRLRLRLRRRAFADAADRATAGDGSLRAAASGRAATGGAPRPARAPATRRDTRCRRVRRRCPAARAGNGGPAHGRHARQPAVRRPRIAAAHAQRRHAARRRRGLPVDVPRPDQRDDRAAGSRRFGHVSSPCAPARPAPPSGS